MRRTIATPAERPLKANATILAILPIAAHYQRIVREWRPGKCLLLRMLLTMLSAGSALAQDHRLRRTITVEGKLRTGDYKRCA